MLSGRGWSAAFHLSGIRVPYDADLGPDIHGVEARTLAAMLTGEGQDEGET